MVSKGATSLLGALKGVGPENLDFFDVTIAPPLPHEHPSMDAYTIVGGEGEACQPLPTPRIPPHTRQLQGDLPTRLTHNNATQQHLGT